MISEGSCFPEIFSDIIANLESNYLSSRRSTYIDADSHKFRNIVE